MVKGINLSSIIRFSICWWPNGYQFMFLSVAKRFYLLFSPSRVATRSELFHVNDPLRFADSGISCAMSFLVSFKSWGYIVRVARVVAPIITKKQIHIVRFFLFLCFLGYFPFCLAFHFLSTNQRMHAITLAYALSKGDPTRSDHCDFINTLAMSLRIWRIWRTGLSLHRPRGFAPSNSKPLHARIFGS